jgi:hypothetical protein
MSANSDFQQWAKGFSGCDGGNLRGAIWLCGIEWGTGKAHDLNLEMREPVTTPPQHYKTSRDVWMNPDSGRPYQFNVKFLKLAAAIRGRAVHDWIEIASDDPFPFDEKSQFFKLNLFPIAFKDVDPQRWTELYSRVTGFFTKQQYQTWCRNNRFPEIRKWVAQGSPRLIIGVGRSHEEDFMEAFGFEDSVRHRETLEERELVWATKGTTTLAVLPFLGPFQLDSDARLAAFGARLAELL